MPDQFENYLMRERARRERERRRQEVGLPLMEILLGAGDQIPPSFEELDPETGRMRKQYLFPSGRPSPEFLAAREERPQQQPEGQYQLPQPPGPVPSPEELAQMTQRFDPRMVATEQAVPPPPTREPSVTPPLGEMPGRTAPPVLDRYDVLGPKAERLQEDKTKRMLKGIAASLGQAGAIMASTPSTGDILLGREKPLRPVGRGLAEQVRAEEAEAEKEIEEAKEVESPLLREYNKVHGTNFKTLDEMQQHRAGRAAEAGIKATETGAEVSERKQALLEQTAQLDAELKKQQERAEQMREQMLEAGDLRGLPEKKKTKLDKLHKELYDKNETLIESIYTAKKGIQSVEINDMAFKAAGVLVARAQGEVGNLSRTEVQVYNRNPGLKGDFEAMYDWARSQISGGRKQAVQDILQLHVDQGEKRLRKQLDSAAERWAKTEGLGDREAVKEYLGLGLPEEALGEPAAEEEKIWVVDPEGKLKPREISPSKLQKYLDAGWERG